MKAAKLEALIPEDVLRVGRRGEHWIGGVDVIDATDRSIPYAGLHHGSSYVEHQRFASAIREGKGPEVTAHDGLLATAVGAAAHRSIDEARAVELHELLA